MSLTYAVGDVHGSLDKLERLIAGCREHADGRPMTFVFLGDYIDRGPQSAGVVRFLLRLQSELREHVIALMGNHEAWALAVADGTMPASNWLLNGGAATLESYGVGHVTELPHAHLDWFRSLRLTYDDGRRFFVHAGVDPKKPLDAQDEFDLLWIREPFLSDGRNYGRLIVHGHTPLIAGIPELRSNRLNLDTAAVFGGPLTAAVFDGAQTEPITFLQAE
ncbi:MAG: metallophosphoesterase family protein [Xanthobacteraceae bacterium]